MTSKIHLSRRNLLALLSKLDRNAAGEETACSIVKWRKDGPVCRQSMKSVTLVAVEDNEYYSAQNRPAGVMHQSDEINLTELKFGVIFAEPLL